MINCPICGTENFEGSQFCSTCGASMIGYKPEINFPESNQDSGFQSANVTSIGVPTIFQEEQLPKEIINDDLVIVEPETKQENTIHSKLIVERGVSVGTEFLLSTAESQIGRWDADNGVFPDIDLDAHDPEAKISRKHARIVHENDKFFVEDLGSTNGTFVNRGRRLLPGTKHILNDGDEIIVGKTFLRFRLNN